MPLLSFSVDYMLPFVEAGVRQANGANVGAERVKRQTIRRRGPVIERLLLQAPAPTRKHPGDLFMWWKSRAPCARQIGVVTGFRIYPLGIWRHLGTISLTSEPNALWEGSPEQLLWRESEEAPAAFTVFARADGFPDAATFRDFFVPEPKSSFNGGLFRW